MPEPLKNGSQRSADDLMQPGTYKPRAFRFPISTPIHYREGGEADWSHGITVNISRTGILFQPERDVRLQTGLEMRILFPPEVTGATAANVACWGPVVRKSFPAPAGNPPLVAAAIVRYRFRHD